MSTPHHKAERRPAFGSFEELYESEHSRIYRLILMLVRDRSEAEDLTQEAFVRVYMRWSEVSMMESPSAYAAAVARNLCRSWFRVRLRERTLGKSMASPSAEEVSLARVRDVLAQLPRRAREAFVLTGILGFSGREAASIMSVKPGTVRALTAQARARLLEMEEAEDE
jgi:RNA polymerase sigma-70 factor (ECF subfamily)